MVIEGDDMVIGLSFMLLPYNEHFVDRPASQ